jgi:DNA-binding transcriptional MerR regulator
MTNLRSSLSIGEAAERTGLSVHTLRYYEREGILGTQVGRKPNGHRVFTEADIQWLEICKSLRAAGMPLVEIREYGQLLRQEAASEPARLALLRKHESRLSGELESLMHQFSHTMRKVRHYERHGHDGVSLEDHQCDGQSVESDGPL